MTTKQVNPLRGVAAAAIAAALSLSLIAVAQAKPRHHHRVYNYAPDPYTAQSGNFAPNAYMAAPADPPGDPPANPFAILPGYDGSVSDGESGVWIPGYHGSNGG